MSIKHSLLIASLALASASASAALITALPGDSTAVAMPSVNYFGTGPQTVAPGITWSSTNSGRQGGSVFGYTSSYGFGGNGFWNGFPMAGVNSSNDSYGVVDSMSFTLDSATTMFGGRINWAGDNVDVTIAAYDSTGNLLESWVMANANGNVQTADRFYGIYRAEGDIAMFTLTAGYIAIADIAIGSSNNNNVPVPATLALALAGLGLAGAASRRRG